MSKNFYLHQQRNDPDIVGRTTLVAGFVYLALTVALFIAAGFMIVNNKIQYTVQFNKMVTV